LGVAKRSQDRRASIRDETKRALPARGDRGGGSKNDSGHWGAGSILVKGGGEIAQRIFTGRKNKEKA